MSSQTELNESKKVKKARKRLKEQSPTLIKTRYNLAAALNGDLKEGLVFALRLKKCCL